MLFKESIGVRYLLTRKDPLVLLLLRGNMKRFAGASVAFFSSSELSDSNHDSLSDNGV